MTIRGTVAGHFILTSGPRSGRDTKELIMGPWLVLSIDGKHLGEVIADSKPQAQALAADRWPGPSGSWHVWSKEAVDRLKKKGEQYVRRNLPGLAHHEAGHAVLARSLGMEVSRVRVGFRMNETGGRFDADADTYGRAEVDRTALQERYDRCECDRRYLIAVLAGPMSEHRAIGKSDWRTIDRRRLRGTDLTTAMRCGFPLAFEMPCTCITRRAPGGIFDRDRHQRICTFAFLKRLALEAARELDAVWDRVTAVAAELQRVRELDGVELDRVLAATTTGPESALARAETSWRSPSSPQPSSGSSDGDRAIDAGVARFGVERSSGRGKSGKRRLADGYP
jgi:hypothetical protein